jgi:UDP-glucose 4-epimerase
MFDDMKVVVTGGAGFIGSHLVDRLLSDGHSVLALDDFSTGRLENLSHNKNSSDLSVERADVADYEGVSRQFRGASWVFHLAALADIVPSVQHPLQYHKANVDGTISVLEAARSAGVKRFVYAASSSCYGIPSETPTPETAPVQPMYPYALTKYLGEQYVLHWHKVYKLSCVSLRLFNVYGPRARTSGTYGAVFGVFMAQKLAGKPFTVVGDGTQTRDFTYVTDAVDAFVQVAKSGIEGEVMNVGSGGTYSVNDLVRLLGGDVVHIARRPGEPACTFADIRKITKALGWRPKVGFEQGVQFLLRSIDDWRDATVWDPRSIAEATRDWFKYLGNEAQPGAAAAVSEKI